jgi:chromate transporter
MEKRINILGKLFITTLYLSAFTFGGGYVIISLMKEKFVNELKWLEEDEMLDLVAIAQSSPGAIAVNGAIVLGYKLGGMAGVLISVLGAIIPPFLILSIVSLFYDLFRTNSIIAAMLTGMKSGVGAVITSVVYDMGSKVIKEKSAISILIMLGSFVANYFFAVNVVLIIVLVAFLGVIRTIVNKSKEAQI